MNRQEEVTKVCDQIRKLVDGNYLRGVNDVLNIFNEKYLVKVWHKEDADKLFDDFFNTLKEINLSYMKLNKDLEDDIQ